MRLGLGNNPLGPTVSFPPNLGSRCLRLKYLQLSNTGLRDLPPPILGLKDLRQLDLSSEDIAESERGLVSYSKHQCRNLLTLPLLEQR